jgi:hypothetical protein
MIFFLRKKVKVPFISVLELTFYHLLTAHVANMSAVWICKVIRQECKEGNALHSVRQLLPLEIANGSFLPASDGFLDELLLGS